MWRAQNVGQPIAQPEAGAGRAVENRRAMAEAGSGKERRPYTSQISIAFSSSAIGSCPWLGEYSWETNPV